jgi:hypothetical protein
MHTVSEFTVGDAVSFPAVGRRYSGSFVGTVEKVGTKNLTIRYTKGAGAHLFIASLDPTVVDVEKVGASRPAETVRHFCLQTNPGTKAEVEDLGDGNSMVRADGFAGIVPTAEVENILDPGLGWMTYEAYAEWRRS